jgi:hypothetical protein
MGKKLLTARFIVTMTNQRNALCFHPWLSRSMVRAKDVFDQTAPKMENMAEILLFMSMAA